MSIRNSLLVLLLLTSAVSAQPVITIDNFSIDSSLTQDFANITVGHPRFQIAPFSDAGDVAFYMSNYPGSGRIWKYTKNLDSTVRWVQTYTGVSADYLNHAMITTKNDFTGAFIGTTNSGANCDLYTLSGGLLTRSQRFAWPAYSDAQWFVAAPIQLGSSDSVIAIGRGGDPEHPKYAISTDGGATFGDTIRIPSNASPFPDPTDVTNSEGRIGGIRYNGTAAAIYRYQRDAIDSASMIWWEFNRATKAWDEKGHPIDRSFAGYGATTFYRSFAANSYKDTTRFVVHSINNVGGVDSVLWAYRNLGAADWTRGGFQTSTFQPAATNYPFVALTYIQSSQRLVVFYTQDFSLSNTDRRLYMRYWDDDTGDWSTPTLVSRYSRCINVTTAQIVPTSHGDVCYAMFSGSNGSYFYAEGARITFTEQTTINITSLPYTISTSSQTYTINGAKLTSQTNGITLASNVHDVIIDGQGDTIEFDLAGATVGTDFTLVNSNSGNKGIIIGAGCYNVTIKNLVIKHNPPANIRIDSTLISNAVGIRWAAVGSGSGTHDILIEGCHISIAPVRNAWAIVQNNSAGSAHYNNIIRNNTIADSCNAWARRDYWQDQTAICLLQFNYGASTVPSADRANFQYHLWLYGNDVQAMWANLYIEGDSSVILVENNTFSVDGWNRLTGTPYAASVAAVRNNFNSATATEAYCISVKDYTSNPDAIRVRIINNRFNSGVNHAGGRGIFTAGAKGRSWTADDHIYIAGNTFDVHQGEDGAGDNCMGFIARQGSEYVTLRDNYIRVTGDNNDNTSAYGRQLVPVRLTCAPTSSNLRIIKNTLVSYFNGTAPIQNWRYGAGDIGSYGIMFDEADDVKTNWTIDSNTTLVQGAHLQYGWYNGPSGACRVTNHTFGYYPGGGNNPNDATTWVGHQGDAEPERTAAYIPLITSCLGNEIVDPLFINGTTDNHFLLEDNGAFPHSSVKLSVTARITVNDNGGSPQSGATVTITNAYGTVAASGTTNASGVYTAELPYWYEENVAAGNNDSTAFNPYTVSVTTLSAATASAQLALDWDAKTITLVAGTSTGEDRPITHIGGKIIITGNVRIDNADVPDLNDPGNPTGD